MSAASSSSRGDDSPQLDELFQRLKEHDPDWLSKTLYERWIELSHVAPKDGSLRNVSSQSPIWPFDVTLPMLPESLQVSPYVHFIRSFDWASTGLGPMAHWRLDLRKMVNMCLCDKRAAAVWIGPKYLGFYNEGYSHVAGQRHPDFLGRPFSELWPDPDIHLPFQQYFDDAQHSGKASKADEVAFILDRNGFREELWVSWSVIPVADSAGGVFGVYNTVVDSTQRQISSRRLSTLVLLGQCTARAVSVRDFWDRMIEGCEPNLSDIPFAVLYSKVSNDQAGSGAGLIRSASRPARPSSPQHKHWKLHGTVGIPADFEGLPSELDFATASDIFYPGFNAILDGSQSAVLSMAEGTFPKVLHGVVKSRVHGDLCDKAVVLPIGPTNREDTLGFMIIGISPVMRYDADYAQFIELLARQFTTSLASVVLLEEEISRSRMAAQIAAQDRFKMSIQLAEVQQKAADVEHRFKLMADMAPVAMFHLDQQGRVLYANQNWLNLTQHPLDAFEEMSWMNLTYPEDRDTVEQEWSKLLQGDSVNFEMRWKRPFETDSDEHINGERIEGPTWTIASAYAEKHADGSVKGILGCLTDISRQKHMEGQQSRRMEEALELKRQQENFMDMTSHEARNPLSAIMLCAESILTMLKEQHALNVDPVSLSRETIESNLEGAEIIMACAQHQKRIIDDVLTLSKLDSGLLTICAVEVQPAETIAQAMKMFDGEVNKCDIKLQLSVDKSYQQLEIGWVRLDPSRMLQVLINLLTNAIKFTQSEPVREITVTLSATQERPTASLHGVSYIPDSKKDPPRPEHDSNAVYIGLEVIDTGRGITPDEMTRLFAKFQQASPKTHVEYGGSGLGLFICRQLTRMQNGSIGVSSAGKGANFAFYVAAPRCTAPEVPVVRKDSAALAQERAAGQVQNGRRLSVNETAMEVVDEPQSAKKHILIVEDNLVNQKVMRNQLERLQYVVNVANHGLEALDHIRRTRFCRKDGMRLDIVLLDVEMPICNGLECAKRIRQLQAAGEIKGHVPIVGVTANARAEQQAGAIEAGMDTVVTKPFRLMELSAELDKMRVRFS